MSTSARNNRNIQAGPQIGPDISQRGNKPIKAVLSVLSVLALSVSALGYFTIGQVGNTVASAGNLTLGGTEETATDGAIDILLVGSDSRTDAQGNQLSEEEIAMLRAGDVSGIENTDTIMVMRVPNDGSSATAVSIPRDTYIHDDEFGNTKINAVYGLYKDQMSQQLVANGETDPAVIEARSVEAGRQGLINAVRDLSGIEVDHYAEVGLLGFVLLTDAVGGVEVCLNNAVYDEYSGADFPAGVSTLNGAQALSFVRQRHGLPRGDLDRVVRQQAYLASLANKVLSTGTLTNPARLRDLASAAERSMIIDEGWDIMSFANQIQGLAGGNVSFNTIPVTSMDGVGDYGESIVTVNVSEVHAFFDQLLGDKEGTSEAATEEAAETTDASAATTTEITLDPNASITVLNAGNIIGLANSVGAYLTEQGYSIAEVGNPQPGIYISSAVLTADTSDATAQALANELNIPVEYDSSLPAGTYYVILADDYLGPQSDNVATSYSSSETDTVGSVGSALEPGFNDREITAEDNVNTRCVN